MDEDCVQNTKTWLQEAEAVINDIKKHVRRATVSSALKNDSSHIFINLTTLEDRHYCVEMSGLGFRVVGRHFDDTSLSTIENMNYETPYSLLDNISEAYRQSFGGELMSKLMLLAKRKANEEEN